ncbi:MAG: DUF4272 domain-containing protein, partial [Clostridiales bacterium]|nr:DUF4272 domain-containing protein [Clostridiales bacterium]
MKTACEIFKRSAILVAFQDRCVIEQSVCAGISYTLEQREKQRLRLYSWIEREGLASHLTALERSIFETKMEKRQRNEILKHHVHHEAVEPLLWAVGLVPKLSSYNGFVKNEFHEAIKLDGKTSMESVAQSCKLKSPEELSLRYEIAMLWYWRAIEKKVRNLEKRSIREIIPEIFGEDYKKIVDIALKECKGKDDFVVFGKNFNELTKQEMGLVRVIAEWRYHAFAWMLGDEAWDEVELNT